MNSEGAETCRQHPVFGTLLYHVYVRLMAEWLYSKAGELNLPDSNLSSGLKKPELSAPVQAFIANASRFHAFWKLNPHLIETASAHLLAIFRATLAVTGTPFPEGAVNADEEVKEKIIQRITEDLGEAYRLTGDMNQAAGYNFTRAITNFETLVTQEGMDEAVYATFASQLTGAWTAWETLAGDLWKTAVNLHPRTLVSLRGLKRRIENKMSGKGISNEQSSSGKREQPQVSIDALYVATEGTFDASDRMGIILKEKFSFQRLEGLREAYSAAFSKDCDAIDLALSNSALDKLNLVRNLLLHNAGVVDEIFISGVKAISDWKINCEISKQFPLNGETVRDLINPVFALGVDLIHAVDDWIVKN